MSFTKFYFLLLLVYLVGVCSAFDLFEGMFQQGKPCFSVYKTPLCNKTLVQNYLPQNRGASLNDPDTKLWLFTAKSPWKAEQLHNCGGGLPPQSTFDPSHPTEIFMHGWLDGVCRTAWMREVKEQLFQKGSYNVILVDWTWGNVDHSFAATNAKVVGEQIAFSMKTISRQVNYDCKKFHFVGHSYGAIGGGVAGKFTREECKIGRITALDYSMAPFKFDSNETLLNPEDAHFVDAIHTNIGECFPFNHGQSRTLGHVDFYVNNGAFQPACVGYIIPSLLKLDVPYALLSLNPVLCSHFMALQYYKVSINAGGDTPTQFVGVECDSYEDFESRACSRDCTVEASRCMVMGMDSSLYRDLKDSKRRTYYVPTSFTCPYTDYDGFKGLPLQPKRSSA